MEGFQSTREIATRAGGDQSHLAPGSASGVDTNDGYARDPPLLEQVQEWLLARADLWALHQRSEPCTSSIGAEVQRLRSQGDVSQTLLLQAL